MALIPRLWSPSPFITWDEPTWTYRALQFARGLQTGDLAATHQSNHPGVPTMWAGTAGILGHQAAVAAQPAFGWRPRGERADLDLAWVDKLPEFDEDDTELLDWLWPSWPWARAGIAFLTAGLVTLTFVVLLRLLDARTSLVAAVLLSVSPYFLAHSRVLQLDAVLAAAMVASVVALAVYLLRGANRYVVLSGALAGFAALEKSPALFLVPFTALMLCGHGIRIWRGSLRGAFRSPGHGSILGAMQGSIPRSGPNSGSGAAIRQLAAAFVVWLGALAATYVLLWPAVWVAPLRTLGEMFAYATASASGAREAVYFWGAVQPDPGVWFYVGSLPHRVTPLVVVGLAAAVLLYRRENLGERTLVVALLFFAALFTLFMGSSAKKFERYILPAVPALAVVASIGLSRAADVAARFVGARSTRRDRPIPDTALRRLAGIVLAVVLAAQAAAVFAHHPYYLAWYNPLAGGGASAARRLPVGWGEGMDLAAEYLNEAALFNQRGFEMTFGGPSARISLDATVSTPSVTLLAPLFHGTTVKARDWEQADYVVLYVDDVQIGEPDLVNRFHGVVEPEHVVTINGIDYAWIYRLDDLSQ